MVEVSENLKQIVSNDTMKNTDIVLVTSVVEKIIDSLKVTQKNENQVRFCSDLYLEVNYCPFLSYVLKIISKNYLYKYNLIFKIMCNTIFYNAVFC